MSITTKEVAAWFEWRAKNTQIPAWGEMFQIAAAALREKAEREDPKPLTLDELRQMGDEVVWLKILDKRDRSNPHESALVQVWVWNQSISFFRFGNECDIIPNPENYGKTWICYRHKPKEVNNDANH